MKRTIMVMIVFINLAILITNIYAINSNQHLATEVKFKVTINGINQEFDNQLVTIDNKTYVQLREISNKLGYDVDWNDEERNVILNKNVNLKEEFNPRLSEEGILESGIRYKYLGIDENGEFNLEDYIKKGNFIYTTDYKVKIDAKTPKEAAGEASKYMGASIPVDETVMIVSYDTNTDSWIVSLDLSLISGYRIGGKYFLMINRSDGTMKMYDDGIK